MRSWRALFVRPSVRPSVHLWPAALVIIDNLGEVNTILVLLSTLSDKKEKKKKNRRRIEGGVTSRLPRVPHFFPPEKDSSHSHQSLAPIKRACHCVLPLCKLNCCAPSSKSWWTLLISRSYPPSYPSSFSPLLPIYPNARSLVNLVVSYSIILRTSPSPSPFPAFFFSSSWFLSF